MSLIILDRDGVINEDSDNFIKSEQEWIPIEGSIEAIAALSKRGYAIYVATNQSGLGRGLFTVDDLTAMHAKMNRLVNDAGGSIAAVYYCPHTPDDGCGCRKPLPGLLNDVQAHAQCTLEGSAVVGDSLRDLQAGIAVGCKPVLVRTGKGRRTLAKLKAEDAALLARIEVYDSLADFTRSLLAADTPD